MSVVVLTADGRLTKDPETRNYGSDGKTVTSFSIACTTGFGDKKSTLFFNCTAWGKTGETIAKYVKKGDGIFVTGEPTQREHEGKTYHGVNVSNWSFGAKKQGGESSGGSSEPPREEEDPDSIPF